MFRATAMTVITPSTVATTLNAGIQAGTGALAGMPPQLPKRISIQKAKAPDSGYAVPGW